MNAQWGIDTEMRNPNITTQDIELVVARHFNPRMNLIVPNVWWGWGLRHEADMLVLRPSGYLDEVEIKTTRADIKADLVKRHSHWEDKRIARVWFAVPFDLAACDYIPGNAGVLAVKRRVRQTFGSDGLWRWRDWQKGDAVWTCEVTVVRPAKLRPAATRTKISAEDRLKLAELGAMRIWDLKTALDTARRRQDEAARTMGN